MATDKDITQADFLDEIGAEYIDDGRTVRGKVYRCLGGIGEPGRPSREFVCSVNGIVDEDELGRAFGPGKYVIQYVFDDGAKKESKSVTINIGREFAAFGQSNRPETVAAPVAPPAASNGGFLGSLLGELTPEKITAFAMAIKAVKELFAPPPPPPPVDMAGLITAINSGKTQAAPTPMSDAIVIKALEGMQQHKEKSLLQQLKEFEQVKNLLSTTNEKEKDDEEKGDEMNSLVKIALQYLPQLLQKNNNSFEAAGMEASQNAMIKNLVNSDPDLAEQFFSAAVDQYGQANAQRLAAGFGITIEKANPAQIPENQGRDIPENMEV